MTRRNSKFDTKIKNDFRRRKRPSSDSKVTLKGSKSKNDGNYRKKLHKFQIIGSRIIECPRKFPDMDRNCKK